MLRRCFRALTKCLAGGFDFGWIYNEDGFEGGFVRRVDPPLKNGGFVMRCLDGILRREIWRVVMIG